MITMMKFHEHQHYKKADYRPYPPKWIKVASKLLDDPDFCNMSDTAQLLLIKLWLIASQTRASDGVIGMDVQGVAWRLRMNEAVVYRTIMEIGEVNDLKNAGEPQWLRLEMSPLDKELVRRLDHEGLGIDVASGLSTDDADVELDEHLEKLAESRRSSAEDSAASRLGLAKKGGEGRGGEKTTAIDERLDVEAENDENEERLDVDEKPLPPPKTEAELVTAAARHSTWITPFESLWEARWGKGSFPLNAALRPIGILRAHHGEEKVLQHFELYCQTKESEFATPANFQRSFEEWNPDKQQRSNLTPESVT